MFDEPLMSTVTKMCGLAMEKVEMAEKHTGPRPDPRGIVWVASEFYAILKEMNLTQEQREILFNHIPSEDL